jgi:hypothetical protein
VVGREVDRDRTAAVGPETAAAQIDLPQVVPTPRVTVLFAPTITAIASGAGSSAATLRSTAKINPTTSVAMREARTRV